MDPGAEASVVAWLVAMGTRPYKLEVRAMFVGAATASGAMARLEPKNDKATGAGKAGQTALPGATPGPGGLNDALRGKPYAEQRALVQPGAKNAGANNAGADGTTGASQPPSQFEVLGQRFASLTEVHDFLQATQPAVPEVVIRLTPGAAARPRAQTLWHYYKPDQKIVIDGYGGAVNGTHDGRPTPGYFLSYRPVVGDQSSAERPAAANLDVRNITIRGFESGGIEISPQQRAGTDNRWDGGKNAFVAGAHLQGVRFRDLGSKHSAPGDANWSTMRFGAGGVMMRGVSDSVIEDCTFRGLENGIVPGAYNNGRDGPKLIHAVYMNNQSSRNTIRNNRFDTVSGDAIRVSNGSNDNVIRGNESTNAGDKALVSEWHSVGDANAPQLMSTGTKIGRNSIGSLYGSDTRAKRYHSKESHGQRPQLAV